MFEVACQTAHHQKEAARASSTPRTRTDRHIGSIASLFRRVLAIRALQHARTIQSASAQQCQEGRSEPRPVYTALASNNDIGYTACFPKHRKSHPSRIATMYTCSLRVCGAKWRRSAGWRPNGRWWSCRLVSHHAS